MTRRSVRQGPDAPNARNTCFLLLLLSLSACGPTVPAESVPQDTPTELLGPLVPWPGPDEVGSVDAGGVFEENLSGLTYESVSDGSQPGVLWAVRNGPSNLYRLGWDQGHWTVRPDGTWTLRYPDGTGVPDAEGVTRVDSGPWAGLYVSTERNNEAWDQSRNSVLRFDPDSGGQDGELVATHEWNLTPSLPPNGPNLGIEGIAWISDEALVEAGFVDPRSGAPYAPGQGTAGAADTGGGLFVVGIEGTGQLHLVALDHVTGEHIRIADVNTGLGSVMGLFHDGELGELWAACDEVCRGRIAILRIGEDGHFRVDRVLERPAGMPDLNNEGIALAPLAECRGGTRPVYWTDDDETNGHSIRRGSVHCP